MKNEIEREEGKEKEIQREKARLTEKREDNERWIDR